MEQVQPELDNVNEVTRQLSEGLEAVRQQVQARVMRNELQEVKADVDEEIKSVQRLVKRVDERVNG
jgi:prefoldin subunit 5